MKLTKAKLKQIIKEEIENIQEEGDLSSTVEYFSRDWPNMYDYTSQEWGAAFRDWRHHRDVYQKMKQHLPADQREKIDRKVEEISRFWGEPGYI